MRRVSRVWIAATTVLMVGVLGYAQAEEWNWTVTPFGFMPGMDGDVIARGIPAPVDVSFSDILDNLDLAAMVALDANNGTWGVLSELVWMDLQSTSGQGPTEVRVELEQTVISAIPYYRVVADDAKTADIGAGARFIDISMDATGPRGARDGSQNWVDPILLARVRAPVAESCYLAGTVDIGGFGVESDFTWEVLVKAGYSINETVDLIVGYRHLDIDYKDGDFAYDVATSGIILGAHLSF